MNLGDVRMVHERQRLPLRLEACDDLPCVHAELDDLERDAAAHRLLLLGHVHHAAAAFADLLEQPVAADAVAGFFRERRGGGEVFAHADDGGLFQDAVGLLVCREQMFEALAPFPVGAARLL